MKKSIAATFLVAFPLLLKAVRSVMRGVEGSPFAKSAHFRCPASNPERCSSLSSPMALSDKMM